MQAKKKQSVSPYLVIAILLCVLAVGTAIAILILSLRPAGKTTDTSTASPSSAPVFGTSPDNVIPSVSPAESQPEESSEEEKSVAPPVNGQTFTQPESAAAYERSIGISYSIDMTDYEKYICPEDPMEYVFLVVHVCA